MGYDNERRDDRLEDCRGSSGGSYGELRREERRGGAEVCGVVGIGEFGLKCEKEGEGLSFFCGDCSDFFGVSAMDDVVDFTEGFNRPLLGL